MAGVTVRDACVEDCEQILALMKELAVQDNIQGVRADVESLRKDGFGPNKKFHCFVAEDSSQSSEETSSPHIVGILAYTWLHKIIKSGTSMYIEDLYVKEGYRSRGIGRQLMERAIQVSKTNKYIRIQMTVDERNTRALKFYKQFGYINDTSEFGCQMINIYT